MLGWVFLLLAAALFVFSQEWARRLERRFPPRGRFVDLPGGRLHLNDIATDDAPRATIVLLHGASGNEADMTLPLAAPLVARGFRVVAVDRPGHGWSDRIAPDADDPARQARLIRSALEHMGVTNAIVLGHSWSGALAQNFALDHADFTQGLVLLAPVTHPWPGGIAWYYTPTALPVVGWLFANLFAVPAGLAVFRSALAGVFTPQPIPPDYAKKTGVALVLRPKAFRANARDVAGLRAFVTRQAPRLSDIEAPTAIVSGDRDKIVLTALHSIESARAIPKARLTIVPGLGHSPHHCATEAVVAAICDVAARIEAQPRSESAPR